MAVFQLPHVLPAPQASEAAAEVGAGSYWEIDGDFAVSSRRFATEQDYYQELASRRRRHRRPGMQQALNWRASNRRIGGG